MKKADFLYELQTNLQKSRVSDADDILAEYEQHFDRKMQDGYTEDEISQRLGSPEDVASLYDAGNPAVRTQFIVKGGIALADIGIAFVWILVFGMIAVMFAAAAAFVGTGAFIATGTAFPFTDVAPLAMPAITRILIVAAEFGAAVLCALGGLWYARLFGRQIKSYKRFRSNALNGAKLPPVPIFPLTSLAVRRRERAVILVAAALLILGLVAAYTVSAISAHSFEFWHVWQWFA
ncbi:MAG: DUF1700 domain-containing protein [Oscillospiraceae bacterium]|jgi:uncharacterized membrane protein|nr:DUF1700 domain-containing protein [Oscillospiraceae bacterium]